MSLMLSAGGPLERELEHLRLALSVFQDGSGWETIKKGVRQGGVRHYYAGYRQFERVVADVFDGAAPENKGIFDVFVPIKGTDQFYGVSCKMRKQLNDALRPSGRVLIEMSNAAGKFTDEVMRVVGEDFLTKPDEVGETLLSVVKNWHKDASVNSGHKINLRESSFLVLLYKNDLTFALYQYDVNLPKASNFHWEFAESKTGKGTRRLVGYQQGYMAFEWYLYSGGQLKYYPLARKARWHSQPFRLEPLPNDVDLVSRAQQYFPEKWKAINPKINTF